MWLSHRKEAKMRMGKNMFIVFMLAVLCPVRSFAQDAMVPAEEAAHKQPVPVAETPAPPPPSTPPAAPPAEPAAGQEETNWPLRDTEYGIAAGLWFAGELYAGTWLDKEPSPLLAVYIDHYVVPKFSAGIYANIASMSFDGMSSSYDALMTEIGATLKIRLFKSNRTYFKAGLSIGYRTAENDNGSGEGMAANLFVELHYRLNPSMSMYVQSGFLAQPSGGMKGGGNFDFSPIPLLVFGIAH